MNVARYTPQAVLMANVEEARYEVLVTSEGKTLVRARYAVRNNQRNFLKVALPQGAVLWSAGWRALRFVPDRRPMAACCCPWKKLDSGDEAPAFAVELVYLSRGTAWSDKGELKLALPALDLPVSRTGLRLFHPPLFHVTAAPGTFRTETYTEPASSVLVEANREAMGAGVAGENYKAVAGAAPPSEPTNVNVAAQSAQVQTAGAQTLVDQYRTKTLGSKVSGILPIRVSFPIFGPSIYLVSELTSENQSISAELSYQLEKKKGGSR